MYNQWTLQQQIALQIAAALQQQQLQQQQQQQQNLQLNLLQMQQLQSQPSQPANKSSPVLPAAIKISDEEESDDEDDEQKRTLFCANLDDRVTEELLYEVFLQAGPIESVRIPKDNNGRQRTFGFVTYVHVCTPPYAMRLFQGLTLFRKGLIIRSQESNSAPSTPQQRRSLPSDCETYNRRSGGSEGSGSCSHDNSSSRGGNYDGGTKNPFQSGRNNDKDRISKHVSGQSRPHQNTVPYQRRSGGSEGSNDRGHDRSHDRGYDRGHDRMGNDYQRRYQHSGSNRRSEQRNSNNRR